MDMIKVEFKHIRPALWGFFICIAIAAVLAAVRVSIPSFVNYRWEAERTAWRIRTAQVLHKTFQERVEQLTHIAARASVDASLSSPINFNDRPAVQKVFQSLNSYRVQEDQTIDLIDSLGNVRVWNGPSISSLYKRVFDQQSSGQSVYVTQNGLRTYLTVRQQLVHDHMSVLVSEPLEVNSPISNRFVQKVSFCGELSRILKTQVTLKLPHTSQPHHGEYIVPIVDRANNTIVEFFVSEMTPESESSSSSDLCEILIALCLAGGSVFLALMFIGGITKFHVPWMRTTALILSVWFVRFVWRELHVPSTLIGEWLFNPNLYASPFFLGLSSSLGELTLTVVTLTISAWFLFSHDLFNHEWKGTVSSRSMRVGRIGSLVLVCLISMFTLWLFRGFGEAIRSFIFDSTIRFNNPSDLLPSEPAALMYMNIILLGISLLSVSVVLLFHGRKFLAHQFAQSETKPRNLFIGSILPGIPIFTFLDSTQLTPLISSIVFISLCTVLLEVLVSRRVTASASASQQWKLAFWMTICSCVIGAPLVHREIQQRERKEVETVLNEFLRPSDSWLSYIVQDGLRTSVEGMTTQEISTSLSTAKENNLAFVLWTKSLIGKEGFNSALILYNQEGNEVNRFVVGMNKPEQQNILSMVFAGEEEVVHVIDRTDPKVVGKLYGAWTTIRDSSGQLQGSIAILVSEHQKAIFHEEETEPLRQFGDRLENDVVREIAVHEFVDDSLIFSTGRKLYPEQYLPASIETELKKGANSFLWKELVINGHQTQTVFARDGAASERIAAISLEALDFRWDMFGILKESFLCLALLAVLAFCLWIRKFRRNTLPSLGFRGKLLLGFACITLLPLVVLSYYNKQLVAERVQKQGEVELYTNLIKLQDRIGAYVSDEEDFVKGVDDDFCEALAAEYGVDFSVYRSDTIQASSRSELYRASLLDGRLNGEVFASTLLEGRPHVLAKENIGSVQYLVGYSPLSINGTVVGVLAIPTLNREKEIEAEVSQQNVYVVGVYAVIFGLALAGGGLLALRFARPLQNLTQAVKKVANGNLDINVTVKSNDEIGTLAQSFNDMISKLRTSREELAKHERENAWKEMAKQVAHEIRNPLTPMKLSIQHLRQAFKDKAPEREEILQRVTQTVIEQVEALSRIATEFSHFAKMPERKFERVKIDSVLRDAMNLFKEVQGVSFVDHLEFSTMEVIADSDQLRGVIINIIRNAIQAIDKVGTITIRTAQEGRWCLITISDTGVGIPEEIRSKIFEPNFSTKSEGMGIGLAIARRVIEDHGGMITCQSERGKGTTFEIRLPV